MKFRKSESKKWRIFDNYSKLLIFPNKSVSFICLINVTLNYLKLDIVNFFTDDLFLMKGCMKICENLWKLRKIDYRSSCRRYE